MATHPQNGSPAAGADNAAKNGSVRPAASSLTLRMPSIRVSLPEWAVRWTRPSLPDVAVQFSRDRFTVVRVVPGEKGAPPKLTHLVSRETERGTVSPKIDGPNVSAPADVARELGKVLDQLPERKKLTRISVLLPDSSAQVALLTQRELPRSPRQATEVIRWQVKKRVPFRVEDARLPFQRFALQDGSERVMVAVALESVIGQYEQIVSSLGLHAGMVGLSTLSLADLVGGKDENAGDRALINLTTERMTVMVLRDDVPLFYRSKSLIHDLREESERAHQEIQRELVSTVAYYRDRLAGKKGKITEARLRGPAVAGEPLVATIADVVGITPAPLDPLAGVDDAAKASADQVQRAAPALGLLLGSLAG